MIMGYARVSTEGQNLSRQLDQLAAEKCERIYQEKVTGTKKERPELANMLDNLRSGDTIIVSELTRLSRGTKDLFQLIDQIEKKGANIKSLKETWIDTTTPQGKLMFTIIAGLSQFERDLICQRTKEGLASARARGRKGGRPKKDENNIAKALRLYNSKDYSLKEIHEMTGVSKTSLYRYLKSNDVSTKSDIKVDIEKIAEIQLWVTVENNNSFVRGKKRAKENIENYLNSNFDMKNPNYPRQNCDYVLLLRYSTIEELNDEVYDILQGIEQEADMRNCFTESSARCEELELNW